ncbi:uncharacterized protein [Asterias amurensis]|uniref:uncharacterized protein n=1 Tax=Asterias amurensis TaxID=7602 RepID=UPI003AB6635A
MQCSMIEMTSLLVIIAMGQAFFRLTHAGDFAIFVDIKNVTISVGSMDKELADAVTIPLEGLINPVDVDYDPVEKMVYWDDLRTKPAATISRARLDGSHQAIVVNGLDYPDRLTLDIEGRMIYWTEIELGYIARAPMNGTGTVEIIVEDLVNPREILFDQVLKNIYWTCVLKTNGTIGKSDSNGRNKTIIVVGNLLQPNGLAIDYEEEQLYWIDDNFPPKIEKSDLSGNERALVTELQLFLKPFDLEIYGDQLVWTDRNHYKILHVRKSGRGGSSPYESETKNAMTGGLRIQTEVNYCDNFTKCSNGSTCIDVPNGLRWQCQPGFEGATCSIKSINMIAWLVPLLVMVFGAVAASLTICVIKRKHRRDGTQMAQEMRHDIVENEGSQLVLETLEFPEVPDVANFNDISKDGTSFHAETSLSFPRHLIVITGELGVGNFGRVLLATAIGIEESKKHTIVAVKTIKEGADIQAKSDLLQELDLMRAVGSHPNIVRLLGCCVREDPIYIIMEYLAKGNLKSYLNACKTQDPVYANSTGYSKRLSQTLVRCARDVASGMSFLSSKMCIHRDLAARNVLISDDMECKVSDFGLSRDITHERIYIRKSKRPLPMRWMALESLVSDVYTSESDVWSFGVLLWELVTLGHRPYPLMSVKTMVSKLQNGYRMPSPPSCNEQMYSMMLSCWLQNPAERPSFQSLYEQLDEILTEEMDYLLLDKLDDDNYDDTQLMEEFDEIL